MTKKNKIIVATSIIGFFLLFLFIFFITFSIRKVEIIAQQDNTLNVKISDVEKNSILNSTKIKNGQMIFNVSKQKVKNNVEKNNPQYKVVDVEKKFPNTIYINVKKRIGVMKIEVADTDGINLVVDEDMYVIAETTPSKTYNKKLITVNNYQITAEEYNGGKIIGSRLNLEKKENEFLSKFVSALIKPDKHGKILIKNEGLVSLVRNIEVSETEMVYNTYSGLAVELPIQNFKMDDFDALVVASYVTYRSIKNKSFVSDGNVFSAYYGVNNNPDGYFSDVEFSKKYTLKYSLDNKRWEIIKS